MVSAPTGSVRHPAIASSNPSNHLSALSGESTGIHELDWLRRTPLDTAQPSLLRQAQDAQDRAYSGLTDGGISASSLRMKPHSVVGAVSRRRSASVTPVDSGSGSRDRFATPLATSLGCAVGRGLSPEGRPLLHHFVRRLLVSVSSTSPAGRALRRRLIWSSCHPWAREAYRAGWRSSTPRRPSGRPRLSRCCTNRSCCR